MKKIDKLNKTLKDMKSVVIAYSGGLDSAFLLKAAFEVLGKDNVLAVTAKSEVYPESEYKESVKVARDIGARHMSIYTSELKIKNFINNPVNRCYYCKHELFAKLDKIRKKNEMAYLLDGANMDDLKDIRHGRTAAREFGVRSPLIEVGMAKKDIRVYSKIFGLKTWDKPSFACLASRFPFHSNINAKDLKRVGRAEEYLKSLGFEQVRVRIHGTIARIELYEKDHVKALKQKTVINAKLKRLGFTYVALDLSGYRTGSMHEAPGAE